MPTLKMLIGLPGSGKSTYAKQFVKTEKNWIHLSSDQIAHAKFAVGEPIDHQEVFAEMYGHTIASLESGKNVIYDATNLASKKRRGFLNRFAKLNPETEAMVFLTPHEILKERNRKRNEREWVPDYILERYIRSFYFPRLDEKFDRITVVSEPADPALSAEAIKNTMMKKEVSFSEIVMLYQAFEQTKPLVENEEMQPFIRQVHETLMAIKKEIQDPDEQELLSWATFLHGIGKPYVRKNLPMEEDNFYGHEHVGSYLAYPILTSLQFPCSFVYDAVLLIDEHVIAPKLKRGKIKRRIGIKNYERLEVLFGLIN